MAGLLGNIVEAYVSIFAFSSKLSVASRMASKRRWLRSCEGIRAECCMSFDRLFRFDDFGRTVCVFLPTESDIRIIKFPESRTSQHNSDF